MVDDRESNMKYVHCISRFIFVRFCWVKLNSLEWLCAHVSTLSEVLSTVHNSQFLFVEAKQSIQRYCILSILFAFFENTLRVFAILPSTSGFLIFSKPSHLIGNVCVYSDRFSTAVFCSRLVHSTRDARTLSLELNRGTTEWTYW